MGTYIRYNCDSCGFEYEHDLEIFWIDDDLKLHVAPLLFSTSDAMSDSLVSGYFHEYYCYECNNLIEEFLIDKNHSDMDFESIIKLIESYEGNLKMIKFGDEFQSCLDCSQPLQSKSAKLFSVNNQNEFNISDEDPRVYVLFENNENDKFWGVYHGYLCDGCGKQINKFIIKENSADLDENTIKTILEEHTNDLTVLIFDHESHCPNCNSEIKLLGSDSVCPKCREGHLRIVEEAFVD